MARFKVQSGSQQVASILKEQLLSGRWKHTMPGRNRLVEELGVSGKLIDAALVELEREGLLEPGGPRRRRKILVSERTKPKSLRIAFLDFNVAARSENIRIETFHAIMDEGHTIFASPKTLEELNNDVNRVAKQVQETDADAWIVHASGRDVLEWFYKNNIPVFALFGRRQRLPIAGAGPDKPKVMSEASRRLIALGHKRIVILARSFRRVPEPGLPERAFLTEMESAGITTSSYNLPEWKETRQGFQECLDRLVSVTPPTAIFIDETLLFNAALLYLTRRGIRVPEDISLICNDGNPDFDWCKPSIAHIYWDVKPVVRRVVRWASNISRGREDIRQTLTKAIFVEGGTVGPARAGELNVLGSKLVRA